MASGSAGAKQLAEFTIAAKRAPLCFLTWPIGRCRKLHPGGGRSVGRSRKEKPWLLATVHVSPIHLEASRAAVRQLFYSFISFCKMCVRVFASSFANAILPVVCIKVSISAAPRHLQSNSIPPKVPSKSLIQSLQY
jgi:hypothetical protein